MKTMKKTLSLFLALVMCLGMVNFAAFAEEGETHEHNQLACTSCGETGTVSEVTDCPNCDGPYEPETITCEACNGNGKYEVTVYHNFDDDYPCPNNGFACNGCEDCNFGYAVTRETQTCETCGGTGEITLPGLSDCEVCGGEGKVLKRVTHIFDDDYPCPNNGFACNGCEDCTMGYAVTYEERACNACNGFGVVAPEGADVCATCGGIGEITSKVNCTACGGTGEVACTGAFDDGKLTKNDDGTGTVTYTCATCGASYDESRTHAEVVAALGDEGHVISGDATEHKDPTCSEEGYDKYVCSVDGCGAEFTVPVAKLKHNFKNHVCENCGALSFTIYGSRMGYAYRYNGNPNAGAETYGYTGPAFDGDHTLTMENLGLEDDRFGMFGEFVTNYATSKTWQCVGFVPADSDYDAKDCFGLTYTNSENTGDFQYAESLDAVKAIVAEKGGALYGAAPEGNSFIGRSGIVAVWFVDDLPVKAGQFVEQVGEYGLNVEPVAAPATKENSAGVSIGIDPDSVVYVPASGSHAQGNYVRGSYTVDMVIRIDKSAPNNVHVNLAPGLAAAQEAILPKNGGAGFQPGDRVILNISIDNQSGKAYSYVSGSGFVATDPDMSLEGSAGTGFDGFQIPVVEWSQYSYIARRTDNQPLKDLGLDKDITDAAVGAALKLRGYGADSELSNEEIAQTYLADYYLDWTNAARSVKGLAPVSSFQDLGLVELSVFTNGANNVHEFESCEAVVEGLYYFYYGAACTYNGKTIYQQMQDYVNGVSELEEAIPAALNGTDYDLNTLELDGEHVNNGYQNTQFSFRMEFDLTYTPEPPVYENHYYYQLITYYITHMADGTIRYDGVNVQQVEVTEGKRNEVYTANEGESGKYFFAAGDYTEYKDNSYSFIPNYTPEDSKYRDSVHEIKLAEPNTKRNPYTLVMWYERSEIEEEPTPLATTLTVEKVWEGDGDVQRPASVSVQLMKDGVAEGEPVALNEANEWSYTWIALDAKSAWTVEEVDVPEGYTAEVSVSEDGTNVTITNTYTSDGPDEPENPDIPDEQPPLTDLPDEPVEVPDEQPPLVDLPDEQPPLVEWPDTVPVVSVPDEQPPLVDIPPEDVPMTGIPQTGDFSMVWYVTALMSALGLAVLTLKKREDSEG